VPLSVPGFTRLEIFCGITLVLNDNIRLSGRGDSHTMIRGHPNNVERSLSLHKKDFR